MLSFVQSVHNVKDMLILLNTRVRLGMKQEEKNGWFFESRFLSVLFLIIFKLLILDMQLCFDMFLTIHQFKDS